MVATGGYFESWVLRSLKMQLGLAAAPSNADFRLILHNDPAILAGATHAQIINAELIETGGYVRTSYTIADADITWDAATNRAILPSRQWTITASGASLQFSGVVLLSDAAASANAVATADLGASLINATAHGLAEDDAVTFTSEGAVFGGLTAGQIYYVINPLADTFQISATVGGAAITLTDAGSGTVYLRYANGTPVAGFTYDVPQDLFDGQAKTFEWSSQGLFNSLSSTGNAWG